MLAPIPPGHGLAFYTFCQARSTLAGRPHQMGEFAFVQPDQMAVKTGIDHRVSRSAVGMRFEASVATGTASAHIQLAHLDRCGRLRGCGGILTLLSQQPREHLLLKQHSSALVTSGELARFDFADSQLVAACRTNDPGGLSDQNATFVKLGQGRKR